MPNVETDFFGVTIADGTTAQPEWGQSVRQLLLDKRAIAAEQAVGAEIVNPQYKPRNAARYGAKGDGIADDSIPMQTTIDVVAAAGGTAVFPHGRYRGHMDLTGISRLVTIQANWSTFLPASAAQSEIVRCDHSGDPERFQSSFVTFREAFFSAAFNSATRINHCVNFNGSAAKFYDSYFYDAALSCFLGYYAQYSEFWSCEFFGAIGAHLLGAGPPDASNEVLFDRCKFLSCTAYGVRVQGGFTNRLRACTFQGMQPGSVAAIALDADDTGFFATNTYIEGGWFEQNQCRHIYGRGADGVVIDKCSFYASGGLNEIEFNHCYNLRVTNNSAYAPMTNRISHPHGNADTARLTFRGNNWVPILDLEHPGETLLDIGTGDQSVEITYVPIQFDEPGDVRRFGAVGDWS